MPQGPSTELQRYRDKRSASATPEPFGRLLTPKTGKLFVVQQHQASHLHWDLRLEIDGVLRSWAVPKGPSRNMQDKRFAALVEDHPLDYADFEGRIPAGNYGAGLVIVWDRGTYTPLNDFARGFETGKLLFELKGYKLRGRWTLVRIRDRGSDDGRSWLLIKERDQWEQTDAPWPDSSVLSGMTLEELDKPEQKARRLRRAAAATVGARQRKGLLHTRPMLASAGDAFDRSGWLFEFKYDGYRVLIERDGDELVLRSRNGHDLTASFPEIARSALALPLERFVIDGELVVTSDAGLPDFSLLQARAALKETLAVARAAIEQPCTYYAFDALQLGAVDLREARLSKRKALLARLTPAYGAIRYSEHVAGKGRHTYANAVALGLEGMVGKRADSSYAAGRSSAWIKVRAQRTDDFVITGWTPERRRGEGLGALALGEYRNGTLTSVGRVGSGLGGAQRQTLEPLLAALPAHAPPAGAPPTERGRWVAPRLVCEVAYREYTRDGNLRHPVFVRLRDDKAPEECRGRFDEPETPELAPAPEPEVTVTNRDKVFYPEAGYSKGDLVRYYETIAPWMLPYLKDRPLVLTRFPDGIHGKSFYQRDAPDFVPDWIRREVLWSEGAEREVSYFIVDSAAALKYLANLGTVLFHSWHSRIASLAQPDWCVLDLDPKDAPFKDVVTLARAIGELCEELELPAYPKTSGASGLHVLIPLAGQLSHDHARTLGELMARVIVARHSKIATIARSLNARKGRVYVDYLQNGQGRLLVAPFSARAEPAASVSMPLRWSEVNGRLSNERFHLGNAARRLRALDADPLAGVLEATPDLPRALARLGTIIDATAL